jgi:arylsulfatase A-like enzyme
VAKYAFDEYAQRSMEFVKKNRDNPFFLYLAYTIPHGACIIPDLGIYNDMDWPVRAKEYAAMITHMDHAVGELFSLLEELGLDENTLVFFASDNGVTNKPMAEFFDSFAPVRGGKGDTYDGAYRVPAMARWPGVTEPGQVSDFPWAFWDFLPTVAEITGQKVPEGIDGISILPLLTGKGKQKTHEFLYWEFQNDQSVRYGKWFARKPGGGTTELYDLEADPVQSIDLSNQFPEIIKEIEQIMRNEHSPSDVWPTPGESEEDFAARLKKAGVSARPDNISLY